MAIPKLYQCNYMPEISENHSEMSIALGSLIFIVYFIPEMRQSSFLNDLMKRVKTVYIPTKHRDSDQLTGEFDMTIENIDENTRRILFSAKKPSEQELKFNKLVNDINSVLFYLSNV